MSKKLISLLLAVCMLFCLSACGTTEISSKSTNTPSESQTDTTQNIDENTLREENSQVSSNTEKTNENDSQTQTPVSQSKPTSTTNQPTHTHSYSNATCTSPKKCSCGATAGTALGHQFSSATCTSPQICSRCGATSGNALGHSYSVANCTSPKSCTRCGQTSGSALGHNYVNNKCSRCGKVDPDSLPIGLDKAYLIDSQHYQYKSGIFTDSFGNKYTGVHFYDDLYDSGNGREAYSIFNLSGQYTKLTGSIVAADNTYANGVYYINVYVDNVLAYSKTGFTKTSGKVDFNINVKGAQQVAIRVGHEQTLTSFNEQLGIVNAQLSK